ncbi:MULTISPECIES: aconitate hydratase [Caproicibacterium]|jgi:aconitate hydratase|uniref:Aconitate hydratase n=1 Tax=Caproicibacterium lactatifermentans TaxID=2666138 RepID=A0A859DUA8_9FIRM|nr:aconitate hydratase [Caproicibacterium lactatifermentans]ARP50435.1 aconitate hydratase [Ruminococcaceae bacterium CPB6]QKN23843.1 aconitate hydratase [Caproicibacterium lactatifermentans]QKO31085.1 aconitate hydratase [Caproicibacterium lactatifermentans]
MGLTIAQKIIKSHLVSGNMTVSSDIGLHIDQTLTQDATGTMAYLEFEAMGIDRVKTEKSVAYIDHNTLQTGFENADDHRFIQTTAQKHGIWFSRPGNGICHQVHLERFGVPGKTLIGSDSHTPTGGGIGMLAIGAGGLDVAVAMGGGAYHINMPKMLRVNLTGKLPAWVSAKDIILKVLQVLTVKGGVGKIVEYAGEGVSTLTVPERATITNMGAELGATTSIFPSDEVTREFLAAQGRDADWKPLASDPDAVYDEEITIDLSSLEPMAACPHSPDNVRTVRELAGMKIDQVCIGSCTNSSYLDMMRVASILKGKTVANNVSLAIAPGSKQVYNMLAKNGALGDIIGAGARVLECACGPCIGMGQSPNSAGISLRTFNRNFEGRSGTKDGQIYLVSPETAAASALAGVMTDPRTLGAENAIALPKTFLINDNMVIAPASPEEAKNVEVLRGPNIKPFPSTTALAPSIEAKALLKVGDNITTDHIMPAGAKILPYRSNIPRLSDFCFTVCDPDFPERARKYKKGIIVGGHNYGQGSSREHAALVPLYLGIKAVLVKSFARIHCANLVNAGIVPLVFQNQNDYDQIDQMDELSLPNIRAELESGLPVTVKNETKGFAFHADSPLTDRQRKMILAGGLLNYTKAKHHSV